MIEFKITADNAADFLADLLATASKLTGAALPATGDTARGSTAEEAAAPVKDKPVRRSAQTKADEVKDRNCGNDHKPNAETEAALREVEEGKVVKTGTVEETMKELNAPETPKAEEPKTSTGAALDFDKDVAPLVLSYVKSHGKAWVIEVLDQFGVARASEIEADRLGELVDMLNDKAAA
jgi:hypothetical protein